MHALVIVYFMASWLSATLHVGGVNPQWLLIALTSLLAAVTTSLQVRSQSVRDAIWSPTAGDVLMVLFALWLFAILPWSHIPGMGVQITLTVVAMPLMFFATRLLLQHGLRVATLQKAPLLAGVFLLCIALPEFLASRERPYATFEDSNALAAFWNALFFPTYLMLIADWQAGGPLRQQWRRLALLAALLVALAFSTSLGGQLCWLGGLTLSTVVAGVKRRKTWAALALAILVFLPSYQFANQHTGGSRDAVARLSDSASNPFTERLAMSRSALQAYADQPWYGSGIGTYKAIYPRYRSVEDRSSTGDLAHNDYVQFLLEGGPILLATLLGMATLVTWRLWQLLPGVGRADLSEPVRLRTAGLVIALCCLLAHAVMNFIFYVLPLALVAGFYLAQVEQAQPFKAAPRTTAVLHSKMPMIAAGGFGLFVALTIGLQSLFVNLSSPDCQIRACRTVRAAERPVLGLANLLAATQPTWLPARDYLVARLRDEALKFSDPAEQAKLRTVAALEVVEIIRDVPIVHYPYATLADLIVETPTISASIPASLPSTAADLYRMALDRRPQDQTTRLKLARQLEASGEKQKAFDLVNEEGMVWWTNATVSDTDRVSMLRYMIPRAIALGRCEDAAGMAGSLNIYQPANALSSDVLKRGNLDSNQAGCGMSRPPPAE